MVADIQVPRERVGGRPREPIGARQIVQRRDLGQIEVDFPGFGSVEVGQAVDEGADYGHSRIRSLAIGSTTTAMLRSCRIPVVLVR
jgi:nucleotide-binding universal stress UspA family protein